MALPTIVVVGRPNVGKSSLFNRLTGTRQALVHDTSGVTRDRIYGEVNLEGRKARLIDTGGLVPGYEDLMEDHIREQALTALEEADLVLFVVDAQVGLTPMDQEVADAIRPMGMPVLLVVNKIDGHEHASEVNQFHRLGFQDILGFSALHGYNSDEVVREVLLRLPEKTDDEDKFVRPLRVAFVGKPNVGKSSLINHLVEADRLIVSDVAGTTRESVEVPFRMDCKDGKTRDMVLVDTAGLRRKSKVARRGIEKLIRVTTERAIRMADIVVMMLDGSEELSHQDKHIAGLVKAARKPGILAVNKVDVFGNIQEDLIKWYGELDYDMAWYDYAPRIPLRAKDGRGVRDLLECLASIRDRFDYRIPTPRLNKLLREALLVHPPPSRKNRTLNLLYAHQRKEWPASFTLKVNDPSLVHFSFQRYLENLLRQYGDFDGFPLVLRFQARNQSSKKPKTPKFEEEAIAQAASEAMIDVIREAPGERILTRTPRHRKNKKARVVRTPSAPLARDGKARKPATKKVRLAKPSRGKAGNSPTKRKGRK